MLFENQSRTGPLQQVAEEGHQDGTTSPSEGMAKSWVRVDKWEEQISKDKNKLNLTEHDPGKLLWKCLEEVRQLAIEQKRKEAKAQEANEKAEYSNWTRTACLNFFFEQPGYLLLEFCNVFSNLNQ